MINDVNFSDIETKDDWAQTLRTPVRFGWLCLILHRWGNWIPRNIKITSDYGPSGMFVRQIRQCTRCGKIQIADVK